MSFPYPSAVEHIAESVSFSDGDSTTDRSIRPGSATSVVDSRGPKRSYVAQITS